MSAEIFAHMECYLNQNEEEKPSGLKELSSVVTPLFDKYVECETEKKVSAAL